MTTDDDDSALPAPRPPAPARGLIHDGLEAAERAEFTRPVPKGAAAQFRFLLARAKGSTAAVAARLGISRRTVQRYATGKLRRPQKALQAALAEETARDWQPAVRARVREQTASSGGLLIEARARFGFTAAPGSTDDGRIRRITQHLPPTYASRLFDAQAAGATEQQLQNIAAEGLQEIYFKDRGRRAQGLEVEFTDIDYIELDF